MVESDVNIGGVSGGGTIECPVRESPAEEEAIRAKPEVRAEDVS